MPTTTNFIWDDENYLAESDATNTITVVYTNEPQRYGNLVSSRISGTTSYHHFDALGSTRQLTSVVGSTIDTVAYDAWGNLIDRAGTTAVALLWLGILGYYSDNESGALYIRRRTFSGVAGRWLAPDPVFGLVIARYRYALNSPVFRSDPSGLDPADTSSCSPPIVVTLPPREELLLQFCDLVEEWTPVACKQGTPPCPCDEAYDGLFNVTQNQVDGFVRQIKPTVGIPPFCNLKVVFQKVCVPGAGFEQFGITCSPPNANDDPFEVLMCIPTALGYCEARALIAHEMVHFDQICNVANQKRADPQREFDPHPHAAEKPAYKAQCEQLWIQACGPQLGTVDGQNHAAYVDKCIHDRLPASAGRNRREAAALQKLFDDSCVALRAANPPKR